MIKLFNLPACIKGGLMAVAALLLAFSAQGAPKGVDTSKLPMATQTLLADYFAEVAIETIVDNEIKFANGDRITFNPSTGEWNEIAIYAGEMPVGGLFSNISRSAGDKKVSIITRSDSGFNVVLSNGEMLKLDKNGNAAKPKVLSIGFWDLFQAGGWLMWVLVVLAIIMIFIFVERFLAIRKASQIDKNFMNRIRDFISEGNIEAAIDLCRRTNSPIARMVEKGIERIGRPMSDIQTAIENVANVEVAKLETSLPWLSSIAGGAPMIGFLGTVVGMVQVFIDMSANQSGGIELAQLSAGMYVAMVTTVGGLLVGIPAYFGYNYLVAAIERLVFRMEANSIAFMDILNQPVQK